MKTLDEIIKGLNLTEEQQNTYKELLKDKASDGKEVVLELVVANNGEYVKATKHDDLTKKFNDLRLEYEAKKAMYDKYDEVVRGKTEIEQQLNEIKEQSKKDKIKLSKKYEFEKHLIQDNVPPINGSYDAYETEELLSKISAVTNESGEFLGKFTGVAEAYNEFKKANELLFNRTTAPVVPAQKGLNPPEPSKAVTLEDVKKMGYEGLMKLKAENPQAYEKLFNN